MSQTASEPTNLHGICTHLEAAADEVEGRRLSVQTVLDAFEGRAFGPLLVVPAMIIVVPTFGAIPTVPTIMGAFIILIAVQSLCGLKHPWIPKFIADREISKNRFRRGMQWLKPWAKKVDWFIRPRLKFLVTGGMNKVIALLCILLAVSLPPLELLPWAAAVPGTGIFFLGLAMTAKDGVLGLMGMLAAGGVIGIFVWWLWFS